METKEHEVFIRVAYKAFTMCLVDLNGVIRACCEESVSLFGAETDDVIGSDFAGFLATVPDKQAFKDLCASTLKRRDQVYSELIRTRGGFYVWVETNIIKKNSFASDFLRWTVRKGYFLSSKSMDALLGSELLSEDYVDILGQFATNRKFIEETSSYEKLSRTYKASIDSMDMISEMDLINSDEDDLIFSFDNDDWEELVN